MLFNSYQFIFIFLPVAVVGFFLIATRSTRAAAAWLGLASLAFYSYWDAPSVLILLTSIVFNYGCGYLLHRLNESNGRKAMLITAVSANLMALAFFKYAYFAVQNLNLFAATSYPLPQVILPLGISFFTFTQLAFLVDVYRRSAHELNFLHYVLFVSYFPHLIAGPVLHHKQMMPQFADRSVYKADAQNLVIGITIFALGLGKKVLLADHFAAYADPVFAGVEAGHMPGAVGAWIGVLSYTLQLYFDFSAYSDMAIGLSLAFNIRLPLNFYSPYKATSIIEFWRRWHITLSLFLRDYLYIPLGGNRKGGARRYINVMLTMLLGGLWHGAGWTFLIWGGLHGLYLVINHSWRDLIRRKGWRTKGRLWKAFYGATTFVAVVIGWVFFRSTSLDNALSLLHQMADWRQLVGALLTPSESRPISAFASIATGLAIVWFLPNLNQMFYRFAPAIVDEHTPISTRSGPITQFFQWRLRPVNAVVAGAVLAFALFGINKVSPFLYFQF